MNAEINIAHETQISQDGYVQEDSNNIIFKKAPEHFSMTLSKLRRIKNNINYEKKTEYEILLKEGEKLEQEYKLWAQNATLYIKKSNEYFKKNSHKYVYIPNPFPLPY